MGEKRAPLGCQCKADYKLRTKRDGCNFVLSQFFFLGSTNRMRGGGLFRNEKTSNRGATQCRIVKISEENDPDRKREDNIGKGFRATG